MYCVVVDKQTTDYHHNNTDEYGDLTDEKFRRLTGVKKATFLKMLAILKEAHTAKKARGGRPNKISVEDILLMTLEYLREYRTYFHIAGS